eukprot:COSAG02_NODE_971_length_15551_cov_4.415157_13_plen_144_part_00
MDALSDEFSAVFARALADALLIPLERITVLRIIAGSVIVDFTVDISNSEIAALPEGVPGTIIAVGQIGDYALLSISPVPTKVQDDPCATGDRSRCTVAGPPMVAVVAIGLGASVVLLVVLRKVCCKKRAKVGAEASDSYAQWN